MARQLPSEGTTTCFTREDPATEPDPNKSSRPRRILRLQTRRIIIRRKITTDGYILPLTGKHATGALMDLMLDEIERCFVLG